MAKFEESKESHSNLAAVSTLEISFFVMRLEWPKGMLLFALQGSNFNRAAFCSAAETQKAANILFATFSISFTVRPDVANGKKICRKIIATQHFLCRHQVQSDILQCPGPSCCKSPARLWREPCRSRKKNKIFADSLQWGQAGRHLPRF